MRWKLFADLAERAGDDEIDVSVDDSEPTAGDALAALLADHPGVEERVSTAGGFKEKIKIWFSTPNSRGGGRKYVMDTKKIKP